MAEYITIMLINNKTKGACVSYDSVLAYNTYLLV